MASRSWMGLPEFPRCSSWPRLLGACRCTRWFLCRGYCGNGGPARGCDSLGLWPQPSRSCPGASMTSSRRTCTMGTIWGSRRGEGGSALRSCRSPPAPWPSRGRHLCQRGSSTSLPTPWRRWVGGCFSRAGRPPLYSCVREASPLGRDQLSAPSSLSSSLFVLATRSQGLGHKVSATGVRSCKGS